MSKYIENPHLYTNINNDIEIDISANNNVICQAWVLVNTLGEITFERKSLYTDVLSRPEPDSIFCKNEGDIGRVKEICSMDPSFITMFTNVHAGRVCVSEMFLYWLNVSLEMEWRFTNFARLISNRLPLFELRLQEMRDDDGLYTQRIMDLLRVQNKNNNKENKKENIH